MTFVCFTGNICSDVRFGTSTGRDGNPREYVTFNVAVNGMKDENGNQGTVFYSCITSNQGHVTGMKNARPQDGTLKGKMVVVGGNMTPKTFTAKDGSQGTNYSVNVTDLGIAVLFQTVGIVKESKSAQVAAPAQVQAPAQTVQAQAPQAAPQAPAQASAVDEFFNDL